MGSMYLVRREMEMSNLTYPSLFQPTWPTTADFQSTSPTSQSLDDSGGPMVGNCEQRFVQLALWEFYGKHMYYGNSNWLLQTLSQTLELLALLLP